LFNKKPKGAEHMKKFLRVVLLLFVLFAVAGTVYYFYNKSKPKLVTYAIESPYTSSIVQKTVATGSVIPRKEIELKPQLSGIIEKIYVEPGMKVQKGDLIARIAVIPNIANLNNAENRVNQAKINLTNAQKDFNRNKPLLEKDVISAQEFQRFEQSLESALEEFNAALSNLRIVRDGVSSRGKAATNTLVKSTVTGTVLDVPIEEGNSVIEANTFNAGTTIALVANMNEMVFEGSVDEAEVGKLELGMELILTLGAIENKRIKAELEYISPKGVEDQGAIQFEIRAALKSVDDAYIRAGYSANADIVLERRDSVLVVPEGVVQFSGDTAYVEVETSDQVFKKQKVVLGLSDGIQVEVLSGLNGDERLKGQEVKEVKAAKGRGRG
jgi:HlyD family secretion protein